jgi:hypothetical protein
VSQLELRILGARAEPYAAVPTLVFRVGLEDRAQRRIHAVALRCQVQIETRQRAHSDAEGERLLDLFGSRERWGQTLRSLVWFHADRMVPGFRGAVEIDLPVVCSYDFEVGAPAKYLQALDDGEIPLLFLWSGTVFVASDRGFSIEQVPWDREARFRLPVATWREVMDHYFPNAAWIRLHRDSFDALWRLKGRLGLTSWEELVAALLERMEESGKGRETA